ncbi:MAG TPA: hypothetical protein VMV80_06435 [Anaerolineales bacterium]|nr:hypothetical protein [Anaerolineales bacterium]
MFNDITIMQHRGLSTERKTNQLTFLDNITSDLGGKRTAVFFAKCDQYITWNALAEPLQDMYSIAS